MAFLACGRAATFPGLGPIDSVFLHNLWYPRREEHRPKPLVARDRVGFLSHFRLFSGILQPEMRFYYQEEGTCKLKAQRSHPMPRLRAVRKAFLFCFILTGLVLNPSVAAQSDPVTVPDVIGLSLPAAAALLNQNGLALGNQLSEGWTEAAGLPANAISAQSRAPGSTVERGTALDVVVLRSPNTLLVYDAESVTLINQSPAPLDLNGLVFSAVDGSTPAAFQATNWLGALDGGGHCVQLWAVRRTSSQRPAECAGVRRWLSTVNAGVHFWTGLNGVTQFRVLYRDVERAVCEGVAPGQGTKQCAFYLQSQEGGGDVTPYVYLVYTTDRLAVLNQSTDKWMPLAQTTIHNHNPNISVAGGVPLTIGDPQLFSNRDPVADIAQLAPGQCLLFTNSGPEATAPPQDCHVVARLDVDPTLIFWAADFEIISATDGRRYSCPAASADKMTICVVPR